MSKVLDELRCYSCKKKLSHKQTLFDTGWSGVYWCGSNECAIDIMGDMCGSDEFNVDDDTNRE